MRAQAIYAEGLPGWRRNHSLMLAVWMLSNSWMILKDAAWLGVIAMIGLAACFASSITTRRDRIQ